jgi:6-pyruvoyltetrahydropterin/6-carboxytetrahydropterin synthase
MEYTISKTFKFSASHRLDPETLPKGHPCVRLHGHNYEVTLQLAGSLNAAGMVRDYGDLAPFKTWIDRNLDHRHLGWGGVFDGEGHLTDPCVVTYNPTAENLAGHLLKVAQVMPFGDLVSAVEVKETDGTSAVVYA